ncbi:MAG TPA: energy transducer TonB [Opitutaceae bacterium]|jgi:TonB family protein|nr:energy transducer TonB [Opitutaceae bacterium]
MKFLHFIFVATACLALFGCVAQQPTYKCSTPGITLKPENFPDAGRVYPNDGDRPPKVIRMVNPIYPIVERKNGIVGVVTVRFFVDTDGNVVSPVVMKSPNPRLSQAVMDAITQWKFIPGEKNGHKTNVRLEVPVTFTLDP